MLEWLDHRMIMSELPCYVATVEKAVVDLLVSFTSKNSINTMLVDVKFILM